MPVFRVTDPKSGRSLQLTGDSPPTEQELEEVFAKAPAAPEPSANHGDFARMISEEKKQPEDQSAGSLLFPRTAKAMQDPNAGAGRTGLAVAGDVLTAPLRVIKAGGDAAAAGLGLESDAPEFGHVARGTTFKRSLANVNQGKTTFGQENFADAAANDPAMLPSMAIPAGKLPAAAGLLRRGGQVVLDNLAQSAASAGIHQLDRVGWGQDVSGREALDETLNGTGIGAGLHGVGKGLVAAGKGGIGLLKKVIGNVTEIPVETLERAQDPQALEQIRRTAQATRGGDMLETSRDLAERVGAIDQDAADLARHARMAQLENFQGELLKARPQDAGAAPSRLVEISPDAAGRRVLKAVEDSKPALHQQFLQRDAQGLGRLREAGALTTPVEREVPQIGYGQQARAFSGDREIPIDHSLVEPPTRDVPDGTPQAEDLAARGKPKDGLLAGNAAYPDVEAAYKRQEADRQVAGAAGPRELLKEIRNFGPIQVTDDLRSQLDLSGSRWKEAAGQYGLNLFTKDPKAITLDRVAQAIGDAQAHGELTHLPRIADEADLLDALYSLGGKGGRSRIDPEAGFIHEAATSGRGLDAAEQVRAGDLAAGDFVRIGGKLHKVLESGNYGVEIAGPARLSLKPDARLHIDEGSRVTNTPGDPGERPVYGDEPTAGGEPVRFRVQEPKQFLPVLIESVQDEFKALPGQGVPKISRSAVGFLNRIKNTADKDVKTIDDLINLKAEVRRAHTEGGADGGLFDPTTDDVALAKTQQMIDNVIERSIQKSASGPDGRKIVDLYRANNELYAQAKEKLGGLSNSMGRTQNSERIIPKIQAMGPAAARDLIESAKGNPVLQPVVKELRNGFVDDLLLSSVKDGSVNPQAFAKEWNNLSDDLKAVWLEPKQIMRIERAIRYAADKVEEPKSIGAPIFGNSKSGPDVYLGARHLENIGTQNNRKALDELRFLDDLMGLKGSERFSQRAEDAYHARQLGMDAKGEMPIFTKIRTGKAGVGPSLGAAAGAAMGTVGGPVGAAVGSALGSGAGAMAQSPVGALLAFRILNNRVVQAGARATSMAGRGVIGARRPVMQIGRAALYHPEEQDQ